MLHECSGELLGGIEDIKFGQIRILMTPNRHELSENFKTANYHSYQAVTTNEMSEGKLHLTSTCIRSLYETTTNDLYENGTTLAHKNAVTTLGGHNGATVQKYYPKRRLGNSVKNAQAVMSVVYTIIVHLLRFPIVANLLLRLVAEGRVMTI